MKMPSLVKFFVSRGGDKKSAPDTCQGRKNIPRYHPDLSPLETSHCHPVTGMNRPAPRGLLQSGCRAAWAEGLHHLPLALSRFRRAGFVIAFLLVPLYVFAGICQAEVLGSRWKSRESSSQPSSVGKGGSSASGAGAPPICISCHFSRVISSCRGLEPSKGPTIPRSSIWSTRRAARE